MGRASRRPGRADLRRVLRALHRVLRDGEGQSSLVERFDELTKLLHLKVHDERRGHAPRAGGVFQRRAGESDAAVAARVRRAFDAQVRRAGALFPPRFARLRLSDATVARAAETLAAARLTGSGEDPKGLAYEEVVRHTFDKGENQQFFTPRPVVEFMVQLVAGLPDAPLRGVICDPACGTGGFLLYAASAAGRTGQGPGPRLVGFEIDERLAWAARMNLDVHGVRGFSVHHLGGVGALGPEAAPWLGRIDLILTNPPFGSDLAGPANLAGFELGRGRASRRRGVLFVERCLDLLKPGGTAAIVLDESVLGGPSNADARDLLLRRAEVLAVVGLPETAFMPYASVRTSVVVLRRTRGTGPMSAGGVFFARAETVGRKPNGDPLVRLDPRTGQYEPDSDLPAILAAWHERSRHTPCAVRSGTRSVAAAFVAPLQPPDDETFRREGLRLDAAYHDPARREAARALRQSPYPVHALSEICAERGETVLPCRDLAEEDVLYVGLADIAAREGVCAPSVVRGSSLRSAVRRFTAGDILFARLRPELRKVCLIGPEVEEGFASAECLVLAPKPDAPSGGPVVLPELLAVLLRSDLAFGQIMHLVTGTGRPRVSRAAVLAVRLPVPPPAVQRRLLRAYQRSARRAARRAAQGRRASDEAGTIAREAQGTLVRGLLGRVPG